jgi:predicted MPP superfamily phosphohydrolase
MNNTISTTPEHIAGQPARSLSRRQLLQRAAIGTGSVVLAGGGTLVYAHDIEPGWLDVTQVRVTLPRLDPAFNGYRIAQLSDIHMDHWMTAERLGSIVRLVNDQHADLIALTGDYVTYDAERFASALTQTLGPLTAPGGVVATLGNHDHWTNAGVLRTMIRDAGFIDLNNAVHTLSRGAAVLHLGGVDDVWVGSDRLDLVLQALPSTGAAILLAHEPDFADTSAATGRFDLQLSGHSHGGQIVLPLFGPLGHVPYGEKYPSGRYRVGNMALYTNRGVGMINLPLRFNCRPEITVFTLTTA